MSRWGWLVLGLAACSNDPFEPGSWTITAYKESNDTCGRSPEEQGIGAPIPAQFTWEGTRELRVVGFGGDETWVYDAYAASWSAGWDSSAELSAACDQTERHDMVLTVTSKTEIEIVEQTGIGVIGDGCSDVEHEGPCSFELSYFGEFVE